MEQRLFTPREANQRLPLIKKIVEDILDKGKTFRALLENYDGSEEIPDDLENAKSEIEDLIYELEELGCQFKDWNFELGLVDFPAVIDGQSVLLCWRSDEPELKWYHALEEGYAGRKPIPAELLQSSL